MLRYKNNGRQDRGFGDECGYEGPIGFGSRESEGHSDKFEFCDFYAVLCLWPALDLQLEHRQSQIRSRRLQPLVHRGRVRARLMDLVKGFGTTQPYHYSRNFQVPINHPSPQFQHKTHDAPKVEICISIQAYDLDAVLDIE